MQKLIEEPIFCVEEPIGVPCSSSLTLARTSRDPFEICHVRLR